MMATYPVKHHLYLALRSVTQRAFPIKIGSNWYERWRHGITYWYVCSWYFVLHLESPCATVLRESEQLVLGCHQFMTYINLIQQTLCEHRQNWSWVQCKSWALTLFLFLLWLNLVVRIVNEIVGLLLLVFLSGGLFFCFKIGPFESEGLRRYSDTILCYDSKYAPYTWSRQCHISEVPSSSWPSRAHDKCGPRYRYWSWSRFPISIGQEAQ